MSIELFQLILEMDALFVVVYDVRNPDLSQVTNICQTIHLADRTNSRIILAGTHADEPTCTNEWASLHQQTLENDLLSPRFWRVLSNVLFPAFTPAGSLRLALCKAFETMLASPPLDDRFVFMFDWLSEFQLKRHFFDSYIESRLLIERMNQCGLKSSADQTQCVDFLERQGLLIQLPSLHNFLTHKLPHSLFFNPNSLLHVNNFLSVSGPTISPITDKITSEKKTPPPHQNKANRQSVGKGSEKPAIFTHDNLHELLIQCVNDSSTHDTYAKGLEDFGIIYPISCPKEKANRSFLVPKLLPSQPSPPKKFDRLWPVPAPITTVEHQRIYVFPLAPAWLFLRVLQQLLSMSPFLTTHMLWNYGTLVGIGSHQLSYVHFNTHTSQLIVQVRISDPSSPLVLSDLKAQGLLLRHITHALENMFESHFPRLYSTVSRLVPCTHCIKSLVPEPFIFNYQSCLECPFPPFFLSSFFFLITI